MHSLDDKYRSQPRLSVPQEVTERKLLKCTRIDHELDVFDARRNVFDIATGYGFSKKQAFYLLTAITELGNNIVFHSVGGFLNLWVHHKQTSLYQGSVIAAIEITTDDNGPGIVDVELALTEGFSTANSMGCGLSGVARLMDKLVVQSNDAGTRVSATLYLNEDVKALW